MEKEIKKGRPYVSGKPKKINVSVRFDEDEHKELTKQAEKYNMGVAEYIRYLIQKNK